jgi:hypothetical protein
MTVMTLALDFGSSSLRAIYTGIVFKLHLYLMQSQMCLVTPQSVQDSYQFKIDSSELTRSGWVELGNEFYAFGTLANQNSKANLQLQKPKFELAIPKTLAMVGAISEMHGLPNGTAINLGVVLPYAEFSDRQLFEQILRVALTDFKFCGIQKSFILETFMCLPEGAGVMMQGRQPGTDFQDLDLTVLMLGYRDASLLLVSQGEMLGGETERLGFASLVKSVAHNTSQHEHQKLTTAICKAGTNINPKALLPLLNTVADNYKEYKLAKLKQAILEAKSQYWLTLSEWLKVQITQEVDEIIIAGGTAKYLKPELNSFFAPFTKTKILWCEELEKRIRATFPAQVKANCLEYRLADVYGLFFYLYARTTKNGAKTNE